MYVIQFVPNCPACRDEHEVLIRFPAYPSKAYKYKCPRNNRDVALYIDAGAKAMAVEKSAAEIEAIEAT